MRIKIYIKDINLDKVLEELGECICDSPGRALPMYEDRQLPWAERGYQPTLCYEVISSRRSCKRPQRGKAKKNK